MAATCQSESRCSLLALTTHNLMNCETNDARPLVGRWMFCSKVVAWVCFTHFHTMFNGPFKWENTSNGRKERIEWYMNRYVCIQLINCIHAYIYIHIFAFMFLYTHIFALTINTIEFLCCSIDRRIFRPQPCQQFIPKVYPQSFISRNKHFESYFVAWGFPHSGALWEKVSDLLLLFRNQSDQLYGFTCIFYMWSISTSQLMS